MRESRPVVPSERLLASFVRASSEGLWLLDGEGETVWANDRMVELIGPERVSGGFSHLSPDGSAAELLGGFNEDRRERRKTIPFVRRGGEAGWADARLLPTDELGDDRPGALALVLDVTRQHEAEAALVAATAEIERRLLPPEGVPDESSPVQTTSVENVQDTERQLQEQSERLVALARQMAETNKELEAFSYSVSHDLRAPLRAIEGFTRILLERYSEPLDPRANDYLGRVRAAAQRMDQLISDLLQLARITRSPLSRRRVDLTEMARSVAADLAAADSARDVTIKIADGLSTFADPRLLRVVVDNLLGNAWKFTANRAVAEIVVGRCPADDDDVFYVKDNGAGFDMRYAGKLFNAFQRLHTAAEFNGTGVGLASVHRIIARHGGRAWAEGEVGRGATFYFSIPRPAEERAFE